MLAFKRHGSNQSPVPLVMIHGFLCGGNFFMPNIQSLIKDIDVITLDLPGFGDSSHISPVESISEMAKQVLDTLEEMNSGEFFLLGHSMGGMTALQTALLAPEKVRKLIVYAGNSDGNLPERFESFSQSKERIKSMGAKAAKKYICSTWFKDGEADPYFEMCARCSESVTEDAMLKALDAMDAFDISSQVSNLRMPVMIFGAELDKTYALHRLRKLQTRIPNSELYIFNNCSHNAHLEKVNLFSRKVLEFLTPHN